MRFDKVKHMTDEKAKEIMLSYLTKELSSMGHYEIFEFFNERFENNQDTIVFYVSGLPKTLKEEDFVLLAKGHTLSIGVEPYLIIEQIANDSMIITKYIRKKEPKNSKTIGYKIQIKSSKPDSDFIASLNISTTKEKEIKNAINDILSKRSIIWESRWSM